MSPVSSMRVTAMIIFPLLQSVARTTHLNSTTSMANIIPGMFGLMTEEFLINRSPMESCPAGRLLPVVIIPSRVRTSVCCMVPGSSVMVRLCGVPAFQVLEAQRLHEALSAIRLLLICAQTAVAMFVPRFYSIPAWWMRTTVISRVSIKKRAMQGSADCSQWIMCNQIAKALFLAQAQCHIILARDGTLFSQMAR